MYVFVLLILYLLVLSFLMQDLSHKKAQKKFLILSAIPIILIMSMRYHAIDSVDDPKGYYELYETASELSLVDLFNSTRIEPGYIILNKAFASIIPNPQFIFFLEAIICVSAVCIFIYKNSNSPFFGMLFFVTLGTMVFEFTAFRQGIAMSICLFAVEYIKKKKIVPFIILVLLATTFHKTAIVFLPFYFVAHTKPTVRNILLTITAIFAIIFSASELIEVGNALFDMDYRGGYSGNKYGGAVPILIFIITLILLLIKKRKINNYIFVNMLIVGLTIYLLRYATLAAERLSFYFTTGVIVGLPVALDSFKNMKDKIFVRYFAMSLAIMLFLYRLSYMALADYRFFWEVG